MADAHADLVRLNGAVDALAYTEGLARLLLRAELVASSRIEGLVVGVRRLLRADAARRLGGGGQGRHGRRGAGQHRRHGLGSGSGGAGGAITLDILLEMRRFRYSSRQSGRDYVWVISGVSLANRAATSSRLSATAAVSKWFS